MPWHQIGENARCAGKVGSYLNSRKKLRTIRCKEILRVGAWFYLHASKPYCEACATDEKQDVNAHPRASQQAGQRVAAHSHAVDARNQTPLDRR